MPLPAACTPDTRVRPLSCLAADAAHPGAEAARPLTLSIAHDSTCSIPPSRRPTIIACAHLRHTGCWRCYLFCAMPMPITPTPLLPICTHRLRRGAGAAAAAAVGRPACGGAWGPGGRGREPAAARATGEGARRVWARVRRANRVVAARAVTSHTLASHTVPFTAPCRAPVANGLVRMNSCACAARWSA